MKHQSSMDRTCESSQLGSSGDGMLDGEFRRILWSIKQYIPFINSNYQLSLYRSWLEKLSLSNFEKVERNMYLMELARQIRNNTLLPPFNMPPPPGCLKDLPKITHFRSTNSELPNQTTIWPDDEIAFQLPPFAEQNYSCPLQQQNCSEMERNFYYPPAAAHQNNATSYSCYNNTTYNNNNKPLDNFYYNLRYEDEDDEELIDEIIEEKVPNIPKIRKKARPKTGLALPVCPQNVPLELTQTFPKKQKVEDIPKEAGELPKGLEKVSKQENPSRDVPKLDEQPVPIEEIHNVKDDSSWCDLTDASITSIANSLASGDCEKKKGAIVQQRVQRFNEFRKVVEESATQMESSGIEAELAQRRSNTNLNPSEPDAWKKIQNLNEAKLSLKDTNFISADWKKTIEGLQLRLTETLHQNNELKAIINAMQVKMQEEAAKLKDQNQNQKRLKTEQHNKEVDALKQIQADNIKQLEKSFQVKLDEAERGYHQKIDKIKGTYDSKMKDLKAEREHAKKEKDKEIARLTEIVQQQCTRMSNEIAALRHQIETSIVNNNEEKILILQKCVSKMDKLFQKSEKDYQKHVEKLKQELELKDKVMQVQLKTQRAELIARTSSEKQRHFDDVVNSLEVKYIKMLEYHETQVMETKKQDEEKMERLLNLLEKNDIAHE